MYDSIEDLNASLAIVVPAAVQLVDLLPLTRKMKATSTALLKHGGTGMQIRA